MRLLRLISLWGFGVPGELCRLAWPVTKAREIACRLEGSQASTVTPRPSPVVDSQFVLIGGRPIAFWKEIYKASSFYITCNLTWSLCVDNTHMFMLSLLLFSLNTFSPS